MHYLKRANLVTSRHIVLGAPMLAAAHVGRV